MREYFFYLLVLIAAFSIVGIGQSDTKQQLVIYTERPDCSNARALDLPASWSSPTKGGLTVWVCK